MNDRLNKIKVYCTGVEQGCETTGLGSLGGGRWEGYGVEGEGQ